MSDQAAHSERVFDAALVEYEHASNGHLVSHTGLRSAVNRVLEMQREEIAQAIEAEVVTPLDDRPTYALTGRNANMHYAARIARDYGKEG